MKRLLLAAVLSLLLHGAFFLFWPLDRAGNRDPGPRKLSVRMAPRQPVKVVEKIPVPVEKILRREVPSQGGKAELLGQRPSPVVTGIAPAQAARENLLPESASPAGEKQEALAEEQPPSAGVGPVEPVPGPGIPAAILPARPLYQSNPPPVYPPQARRLGQQGTVLLEVLVSAAGRAEELKIIGGSGSRSLDAAALKAVGEWRFQPGSENGRPKAMRVLVPVRFELR